MKLNQKSLQDRFKLGEIVQLNPNTCADQNIAGCLAVVAGWTESQVGCYIRIPGLGEKFVGGLSVIYTDPETIQKTGGQVIWSPPPSFYSENPNQPVPVPARSK